PCTPTGGLAHGGHRTSSAQGNPPKAHPVARNAPPPASRTPARGKRRKSFETGILAYLVTAVTKCYTLSEAIPMALNVLSDKDDSQIIGESWVTTRFEDLEDWAQRNSFWPFPFGTACCAIEFMSTLSSHYDVARFGSEVVRFSPRQSDVLLVAGTINDKMAPVLKKIYDQMADP